MSTQSPLSGSSSSAGKAAHELQGDGGEMKEVAGDDACGVSQIGDSQESAPEEISHADEASSKFILERLKDLYRKHVLKAEKRYHLHYNFGLPTDGELKESEFDATPMVLLIGQYSTGKVRGSESVISVFHYLDLSFTHRFSDNFPKPFDG